MTTLERSWSTSLGTSNAATHAWLSLETETLITTNTDPVLGAKHLIFEYSGFQDTIPNNIFSVIDYWFSFLLESGEEGYL